MVKRCQYCGRYFIPDYRVKDRQKSCGRAPCSKARKKASQKAWVTKNPAYFASHYEMYIKSWRQKKVKDKIPPAKPLERLILIIPADKAGMIKDEITVKKVGKRTFSAHGYG